MRSFQSPDVTHDDIVVQLETLKRLRSFHAPKCRPPIPICDRLSQTTLVNACRIVSEFFAPVGDWVARVSSAPQAGPVHAWTVPKFIDPIVLDNPGRNWLTGQWNGWV